MPRISDPDAPDFRSGYPGYTNITLIDKDHPEHLGYQDVSVDPDYLPVEPIPPRLSDDIWSTSFHSAFSIGTNKAWHKRSPLLI